MITFTHAQSCETPGFYLCSIIICQKLLRSADQWLPHKYIKKQSQLLFIELGFNSNVFLLTSDTVHYTGRSGRALLHCVEDIMQFVVGIRLLNVCTLCCMGS